MAIPLMLLVDMLLVGVSIASASTQDTSFYETFDTNWKGRWKVSKNKEYKGRWKYEKSSGHADYGLLVSEKAKKYGISIDLPETVDPKDGTLVLQYDLRLQKGLECGGAYLKYLIPQEAKRTPSEFSKESPYSIMFGPDKCGATNKIHFIFRHKNPKSGEFIEHHLKHPPMPTIDRFSHVYSAILYANNTLKILVDGQLAKRVDMISDDFEPPVIPPLTIHDPSDKKPSDWDDREKIPDPEASKPEDWNEDEPREIEDVNAVKPEGWLGDEPDEIDDPDAFKPKDWDDKEDGKWEPGKIDNPKCEEAPGCGEWKPPMIRNPSYKGKWKAPLIENPDYQGIWQPRDIPNPNHFTMEKPHLEPIGGIGIEIWTMDDGIMFDNILVTNDEIIAENIRTKTWKTKFDAEKQKQAIEDAEKPLHNILKGPSTVKEKIFKLFYTTIDWLTYQFPSLEAYKYKIVTTVKYGEDHFALTFGILGSLPLLLFAFMYNLTISKRKYMVPEEKVTLEKSKKEDLSTADDTIAPLAKDEPSKYEDDDEMESFHEIEKEDKSEPTARHRQRRES